MRSSTIAPLPCKCLAFANYDLDIIEADFEKESQVETNCRLTNAGGLLFGSISRQKHTASLEDLGGDTLRGLQVNVVFVSGHATHVAA